MTAVRSMRSGVALGLLALLSACVPARNLGVARGAVAAMTGSVRISGVSAAPDLSELHVAVCRREACSIVTLDGSDRVAATLIDPGESHRWPSFDGPDALIAVRTEAGPETEPAPTSRIVRRSAEGRMEVLREERGRVSSLQALGGGAYAYFLSEGLAPVRGCVGKKCRQVPTGHRLVVVAADGRTVATLEGLVDGLAGEEFLPLGSAGWRIAPLTRGRDRRIVATLTPGPVPRLLVDEAADVAGPDLLTEPFRVTGLVGLGQTIDRPTPDLAVLVQPAEGPDPHLLEVHVIRRVDGAWRADPVRAVRLP